jgi:ribosomal protein L17
MYKTVESLDNILKEVEEELKEALFECEKIKVKYTKASAKRLRRHLDKLAKLKVTLRKEMLEYEKTL